MKATPEEIAKVRKLQPRQKECVALLAQGLDLREISEKLFISYWTVNVYLSRCRQKMGFRSSIAMVIYFVRRPELEKILREAL